LHDRDRGERYALRWLSRYLAERPTAMLDDVLLIVAGLRALGRACSCRGARSTPFGGEVERLGRHSENASAEPR
jgi:hypothetical protein